MQRRLLIGGGLACAAGLCLASSASASVTLFTTSSDFTGWGNNNGNTAAPSVAYDADGSTTNGAGNNPDNPTVTPNPGGTSPGGSLSLTHGSGLDQDVLAFSPGEAYIAPFMNAIDPGCTVAYSQASGYGAGTTVAYTGVITMDYTVPATVSGTYFELGIDLAYNGDGYYGIFTPDASNSAGAGSIESLGTVDGQTTEQATIPYSIVANNNLQGFSLGIYYNSDYAPTTPFNVDDIAVGPVPEPASVGLLGLCGLMGLRRRRGA